MITRRRRGWKLALSGSIVAGVGLLVLACEAPRPTMPSGTTGPTAEPAPQIPPGDVVEDSPAATQTETRQSPPEAPKSEAVRAIDRPGSGNAGSEILGLVSRLQPEVYKKGLPLDRAVWIAVDRDGTVRKSWIGPNLYINIADGPQPNRAARYPVGSAERNRAVAERERAWEDELRAHIPEMTIRGGSFALWYHAGPPEGEVVVHLVSETPGILGTQQLPPNW
jgi:hypothetical protein